MQQRGQITMEPSEEGDVPSSTTPSSRSRHNSKLKVLVRSHAMREETSPPRDPMHHPQQYHHHLQQQQQYHPHNGNHAHVQQQPRIHLVQSPPPTTDYVQSPVVLLGASQDTTPIVAVVLSPQCLSPTTTLVPSPRTSPTMGGVEEGGGADRGGDDGGGEERLMELEEEIVISSPKYHDKSNNISPDMTKQSTANRKKYHHLCECQNQNCIKCVKTVERNINNNNNFSNVNNNVMSSSNMLTVSRVGGRGKLRQQSSSQGSFESSSNSPCLSRDSSSEQYTDTTGVDLELFIPETLNRNAKDRALMLRIEQELVNLAKDKTKTHYKFPPMSSYQRMLVHRCAAYFGMDHNIEPTGKCVVVNKTKNTRIPDVEFKEHIKEDIVFSEEPRRSILKRDSNSIEDYRSFSSENRRSKSFEEREEEYEKARRRIFNREVHHGSSEDFEWSEMPWSSTESDYSSRFRLQPPQEFHRRTYGKLIKVHSEDTGDTQRPCVAKSYSFGGYGGNVSVLSRGDSVLSTHSAGPRLLTKQDSGASSVSWRLSPSSSGYKSQSQMSESVTPSPTSTPHPGAEPLGLPEEGDERRQGENHIVWAVTDIQDVPKGSVIIDPQTGRPLKNGDGSVYLYDPKNPPPSRGQAAAQEMADERPQDRHEEPEEEIRPTTPQKEVECVKKSNVTHSSTSPSLPFSPPLSTGSSTQQRRYSAYLQAEPAGPACQYPAYSTSYNGHIENGIYQQSYLMYAPPYGVQMPQQYEARMDPPSMTDVGVNYYVADGPTQPQNQAIAYTHAQAQYWNQPVAFYPNGVPPAAATPPQRYPPTSLPGQAPPGFMTTGYPTNYLATAPAAQHPQTPELVPVYANHPHAQQPVQVVYHQNQPAGGGQQGPPSHGLPPNAALFYQPNQPQVIYTHNPVYQPQLAYQQQQMPQQQQQPQQQNASSYPQSTPTPNSCASSVSGHVFGLQDPQTFMQLAQNMQQLSMTGSTGSTVATNKGSQPYEYRPKPNCFKNSNKFYKGFMFSSSQSSTGTNSPAATVIAAANYCPQNPSSTAMYRTPPETPPGPFVYPTSYGGPPVMFKQVGGVRAGTPGTGRSSRSPTPASEMSIYDRQRMPLAATNIYQGMPYVVSAEARFVQGRNQQGAFKQAAPFNKGGYFQGSDGRSHNKNRKAKREDFP